MKRLLYLIFAMMILLAGFSAAFAQEEPAPGAEAAAEKPKRPNLLRELNLAPEQVKQIRLIYRDKQQLAQQALRRQNQAKAALDEAIYADEASEETVQARLREFQQAHAEAMRLRSEVEFAVRKVLNPEQLIKFRELRQRFMKRQAMMERPAPNMAERPFRGAANPNRPFRAAPNQDRKIRRVTPKPGAPPQ